MRTIMLRREAASRQDSCPADKTRLAQIDAPALQT